MSEEGRKDPPSRARGPPQSTETVPAPLPGHRRSPARSRPAAEGYRNPRGGRPSTRRYRGSPCPGRSARRSRRWLADLRGYEATVDLNTHSLGAHVALEALRGLALGDQERSELRLRRRQRIHRTKRTLPASLCLSLKKRSGAGVVSCWRLSRFRYRARILRSGGSARHHRSLTERPGRQLPGSGFLARSIPLDRAGLVV